METHNAILIHGRYLILNVPAKTKDDAEKVCMTLKQYVVPESEVIVAYTNDMGFIDSLKKMTDDLTKNEDKNPLVR